MSINWEATLWRGLAAEARKAARKVGNSGVKLQTVMLAARCVTKAVRAERTARDEQGDKSGSEPLNAQRHPTRPRSLVHGPAPGGEPLLLARVISTPTSAQRHRYPRGSGGSASPFRTWRDQPVGEPNTFSSS